MRDSFNPRIQDSNDGIINSILRRLDLDIFGKLNGVFIKFDKGHMAYRLDSFEVPQIGKLI